MPWLFRGQKNCTLFHARGIGEGIWRGSFHAQELQEDCLITASGHISRALWKIREGQSGNRTLLSYYSRLMLCKLSLLNKRCWHWCFRICHKCLSAFFFQLTYHTQVFNCISGMNTDERLNTVRLWQSHASLWLDFYEALSKSDSVHAPEYLVVQEWVRFHPSLEGWANCLDSLHSDRRSQLSPGKDRATVRPAKILTN